MSVTSKEVKLGSDTFSINPLPAGQSFDLEPLIFPVVAQAVRVFKKMASIDAETITPEMLLAMDIDVDEIISVVVNVCAMLPPDVLRTVRIGLLMGSTINGKDLFGPSGVFEAQMQGRSIDTWRLLWHAVQVNYPDFFALLGARGSAQQTASPSAT